MRAKSEYTIYRVTMRPLSSLTTPLQADTIFGTLCWAYRYQKGEAKLKEFLAGYSGGCAPMILSDGFVEGVFPRPLLEPLTLQESETLVEECCKRLEAKYRKADFVRELMRLNKELRRLKFISEDYFHKHQSRFDKKTMAKDFLEGKLLLKKFTESAAVLHSSIDRMSGRVREGRLFQTIETYYPIRVRLNVFVKLHRDWKDIIDLRALFEYVQFSGFGADKSTGKGRLELIGDPQPCEDFPHIPSPNAFLSLSSFIPSPDDPKEGYYEPVLKYGKLGGDYAKSAINKPGPGGKPIGVNPFKRPLLMFAAGSVFRLNKKDAEGRFILDDYYGGLIEDVHWDKDIKHYGMAFPVGLRLV